MLHRQTFSTFSSSCVDHFATVFALHACSKSVCSLSWSIVWLIGSFHTFSFYISSSQRSKLSAILLNSPLMEAVVIDLFIFALFEFDVGQNLNQSIEHLFAFVAVMLGYKELNNVVVLTFKGTI